MEREQDHNVMGEKDTVKLFFGRVIFLNHRWGYGWIRCEQIEKDVFFHFKAGEESNTTFFIGTDVIFELARGKKGLIAKNVDTFIETE